MLEVDPESIDALCDRAELYISHQMYEEAVKDYQTANSVEDHPSKVCDNLPLSFIFLLGFMYIITTYTSCWLYISTV